MKISKLIILLAAVYFAACSPSEKRYDLPAAIEKSRLSFSITQQQGHDNTIYLKSLTPGVIPYWDYAVGVSTAILDTVYLPFSGVYYFKYGVTSSGGLVFADSVKVTVSSTDLGLLSDPEWGLLTGGQAGKTWVLDMSAPVGWYGLDYGKGSGDDWAWHPDYLGNEWVMTNRDYGEMTFDLNNAKNYKRVLKDANNVATTCTGKFDIDPVKKMIKIMGCEMLFGGDYYKNASNWSDVKIINLTETSMTLAVIRDKPTPPDGVCYIGFKFKLK